MGQTQEKFYSDLDLTFNIHPLNNDISILYDEYSIEQNMYNVLMANKGDAKFHPEKCLGLRDMLFEPINFITETELKIKIEHLILMWFPRINLINVNIESDETEDGYRIFLTFTTLNIIDEQETTLFLDRIR